MSKHLIQRFKPVVPVIDTTGEQLTITIGQAIKSATKAGFSEKLVSRVTHEEKVGKFLKQYDPVAVASANIKNNADTCAAMMSTCDEEIAKIAGNDEVAQGQKLAWQKVKSTYMKLFHTATVDYFRVAGREMASQEPEKARTPSFPANANVSAPVMAQQVNVIVHPPKEE